MALFENLEKTFGKVADVTVQKSKEVAQLAKLNTQLAAAQRELEEAFSTLGKSVYKDQKDASENPYAQLFRCIAAKQAHVQEIRKQLDAVKEVQTCSHCGTANPKGNQYCSKCGTPL